MPPRRGPTADRLSRRERQIMDAVYRRREATAAEIRSELPDPPSYSAVRATLRVLEAKGHLSHRDDGTRYIYRPTVPAETARRSAMRRLLGTFFDGSPSRAVATLLDMEGDRLDDGELARLAELVEAARRKGP